MSPLWDIDNGLANDKKILPAWDMLKLPSADCNICRSENKAFLDDGVYDLMWTLLFKEHIGGALKPLLGPITSFLQNQGKVVLKQRQEFFALEEKKLALRRNKIQLKRRYVHTYQRTRRGSPIKSSRLTIQQALRLNSSVIRFAGHLTVDRLPRQESVVENLTTV